MKHKQHNTHSQRPRNPVVEARIRALNFILEQNRLLQRDNAALIGMVKRLRDELEEKNGGKPGKPKKRG